MGGMGVRDKRISKSLQAREPGVHSTVAEIQKTQAQTRWEERADTQGCLLASTHVPSLDFSNI